jgi:predicted Zn-dependent protease
MGGLAVGLAATFAAGCGEEEKPPARTASAMRGEGKSVERGASSSSLGDSALEPAAKEALQSEDWARAESLYAELARRQPRNPAGKRGLGIALMKQDKNEKAIEALQGSLEIADDVDTRLQLASAFGAMNRYPSALPHLRKAVKMAPTTPATWTQLADALIKVEKPDGAAEALVESKQACPKCADDEAWARAADEVAAALGAQAEKQLAANDTAGARKAADTAADLRPDAPGTHLIRARLAKAGGEGKAAEGEYRKAVGGLSDAKSDAGAGARLELAALLVSDGNGSEAAKLAGEVVDARGDDGRGLDTLGRACDLTKDTDCARKAYERLAQLSPGTDGATQEAIDHARSRMKLLKSKKSKSSVKGKSGKAGKASKKRGRH